MVSGKPGLEPDGVQAPSSLSRLTRNERMLHPKGFTYAFPHSLYPLAHTSGH